MATTGDHATTADAGLAAHRRPAGRAGRTARRRAPLAVAAVVAALWAAVVSYGPILALAAIGSAGSGGTPGGVARLSLAAWLLGHGVPVDTPADRVTLVPLAVTAFAAWRVSRAGVHASRAYGGHMHRSLWRPLAAAAAVAMCYAIFGAVVARLVDTADLAVSPWRAGLTLGGFALGAASFGAVRHSRARRRSVRLIPAVILCAGRAGTAAAALTLAAGAAAAGVALAVCGGEAAEMLGSYRAGILGQAGITTVCLAYLPNLAVWGAAYLLGPGFSIGVDTIISPAEVVTGPLPALPVLAGLPSAPVSGPASALLAAPLVAAACAGWLLARRLGVTGWWHLLAAGLLAGPVAGLLVRLAVAASAGALGSGRLGLLGPQGSAASLVATVVTAAGATVGAVVSRAVSRRGR